MLKRKKNIQIKPVFGNGSSQWLSQLSHLSSGVKQRRNPGVSNHWNGIWNGTMEWKMEWKCEHTQLQLIRVTGAAQSKLNCLVHL